VLKHLKERRQSEEGFTLIELMVVVLIMGILMAIAIPTFLATQGSAHDAAAKSDATNAFTNEKAYFEDNQVFIDAGKTNNGSTLDANLPWGANGAAPSGTVTAMAGAVTGGNFAETATAGGTGPVLVVEADSSSGNCFYIYDNETSSTAPVIAYAESSAACSATPAAPTAVASGHAGASIATAAPTATQWYTSW
jgi:type IV pilus assembly protein PilA